MTTLNEAMLIEIINDLKAERDALRAIGRTLWDRLATTAYNKETQRHEPIEVHNLLVMASNEMATKKPSWPANPGGAMSDGATHTRFVTGKCGAVHHVGDSEADGGSHPISCEESGDGDAHPKWPGGAYKHHAQGVFW